MSSPASDKNRHRIYVITGKETSLVNAECDRLLDRLLDTQQKTTGLFTADPARISAAEVLDELRTLPFLTQKRVVLIRNADEFVSKNRQLLENYFDKPCPSGTLILTVSSWPARTRLASKLSRVGKLISITQPKPWQLPQRLIKYTHDAYDKKLTKTAAELLIELTGDELGPLYGQIDKLALLALNDKAVTPDHVESLVGHNRLFNAFAVIDAAFEGNVAGAVDRLRNMLAVDKSAEYKLLGAFAFHLRRMFNAKVLLEKGLAPAEVAKSLGIWGNKEAFFAQLKKMSLQQIGTNLQQLAAIDYAIKTGRTKTQVAAEQLVLKLSS